MQKLANSILPTLSISSRKENVMYCHCHLDESSPHIHVGIVPITPDGRLSAKTLFSPKTLEQLQTDFHRNVSSHYGLERGEHHSKKYLPIQKFKAQQAKLKAKQFTQNLQTADINQQKIEQVNKAVHYATTGIIFTSEDKENVQLPTSDFLALRHLAEQGLKAVAEIDILKDDIRKLQHDEAQARSDLSFFLHELSKLEEETADYTAVPKLWRKHIDDSIDFWKKTFTSYCHDLNRAIVRIYISIGDIEKTDKILRPLLKSTGIFNVRQHIDNVIRAAKLQHKNNTQPQRLPPFWNPPKPSSTDYTHTDETGIVPMQLSHVPEMRSTGI